MLRFSIAGVPVGVQPWFWFLAVLLGLGSQITGWELAVFVAVVFVSVLVHELGHAFTLSSFGYRPAVTLFMIGGYTSWEPVEELPPARRIASTLAGPFVGFALAAAAYLVRNAEVVDLELADRALVWTVIVNVVWGVFNLIPIRGLDGGQAVGGFLELVFPQHGRRIAEGVYILTGIAAIAAGIWYGRWILAIFAAVLTFGGMGGIRRRPARPRPATAQEGEPPGLGI